MARTLPKAQKVELMRRAWKLAVAGTPQLAIAEQLGISQSQVSRYLAAIARKTAERLADTATMYAVLSLSQTDEVFNQAMRAFERSTKPKRRATQKKSTSGDGSTRAETPGEGQTTTEVTEREGEPAWLATGMNAIRLRHELLDRFAPPSNDSRDDEDSGDGTVAGALLDAGRRDAAYQQSITDATKETTSDAG